MIPLDVMKFAWEAIEKERPGHWEIVESDGNRYLKFNMPFLDSMPHLKPSLTEDAMICLYDEKKQRATIVIKHKRIIFDNLKDKFAVAIIGYYHQRFNQDFLIDVIIAAFATGFDDKGFLLEIMDGVCREIQSNVKVQSYLVYAIVYMFHLTNCMSTSADDAIENGKRLYEIFLKRVNETPDKFLDAFSRYEEEKFDVGKTSDIRGVPISTLEYALTSHVIISFRDEHYGRDFPLGYEVIESIKERGDKKDIISFLMMVFSDTYTKIYDIVKMGGNFDDAIELEKNYWRIAPKVNDIIDTNKVVFHDIWRWINHDTIKECVEYHPPLWFVMHFDFMNFTRERVIDRLSLLDIILRESPGFTMKVCLVKPEDEDDFSEFLKNELTKDKRVYMLNFQLKMLPKEICVISEKKTVIYNEIVPFLMQKASENLIVYTPKNYDFATMDILEGLIECIQRENIGDLENVTVVIKSLEHFYKYMNGDNESVIKIMQKRVNKLRGKVKKLGFGKTFLLHYHDLDPTITRDKHGIHFKNDSNIV